MYAFLKQYYPRVIATVCLLLSFMGLIIYKQKIEQEKILVAATSDSLQLNNYEFYFTLLQWGCLLAVGYLMLSWLFKKYKAYRQLKNERTEAELALLKSKIDPHFFFNTLNNLYSLAIKKSDDTPVMIQKLSEVMRYTIYEGENQWVTISQEITYLEQYIAIHRIRYKKKVTIDFIKDVHNPVAKVTPLLFIMLLENAFKHGVESLTDQAYIKMALTTTPAFISFKVENNFEPKPAEKTGIGLANLRRRLGLLYPKMYELTITENASDYTAHLMLKTI